MSSAKLQSHIKDNVALIMKLINDQVFLQSIVVKECQVCQVCYIVKCTKVRRYKKQYVYITIQNTVCELSEYFMKNAIVLMG